MRLNTSSHAFLIRDTVEGLRRRYTAAQEEPFADFEHAQALYENLYACERLKLAINEIPHGIRELESCLRDAPDDVAYAWDKRHIQGFIEHGKEDLEKAREDLARRKLVLAGLEEVKNDRILRILLFSQIPFLRELVQDSWQIIMDLLSKDFTYEDALAAMEAIADRDLRS